MLSQLVTAHAVSVTRKRKEREELLEWCAQEAAAVDKRARAKSYFTWLVTVAVAVDWNADPAIDIN